MTVHVSRCGVSFARPVVSPPSPEPAEVAVTPCDGEVTVVSDAGPPGSPPSPEPADDTGTGPVHAGQTTATPCDGEGRVPREGPAARPLSPDLADDTGTGPAPAGEAAPTVLSGGCPELPREQPALAGFLPEVMLKEKSEELQVILRAEIQFILTRIQGHGSRAPLLEYADYRKLSAFAFTDRDGDQTLQMLLQMITDNGREVCREFLLILKEDALTRKLPALMHMPWYNTPGLLPYGTAKEFVELNFCLLTRELAANARHAIQCVYEIEEGPLTHEEYSCLMRKHYVPAAYSLVGLMLDKGDRTCQLFMSLLNDEKLTGVIPALKIPGWAQKRLSCPLTDGYLFRPGMSCAEMLKTNSRKLETILASDIQYILHRAEADRVITMADVGELSERYPQRAAFELLDLIIDRGEEDCDRFINVLQDTRVQDRRPELVTLSYYRVLQRRGTSSRPAAQDDIRKTKLGLQRVIASEARAFALRAFDSGLISSRERDMIIDPHPQCSGISCSFCATHRDVACALVDTIISKGDPVCSDFLGMLQSEDVISAFPELAAFSWRAVPRGGAGNKTERRATRRERARLNKRCKNPGERKHLPPVSRQKTTPPRTAEAQRELQPGTREAAISSSNDTEARDTPVLGRARRSRDKKASAELSRGESSGRGGMACTRVRPSADKEEGGDRDAPGVHGPNKEGGGDRHAPDVSGGTRQPRGEKARAALSRSEISGRHGMACTRVRPSADEEEGGDRDAPGVHGPNQEGARDRHAPDVGGGGRRSSDKARARAASWSESSDHEDMACPREGLSADRGEGGDRRGATLPSEEGGRGPAAASESPPADDGWDPPVLSVTGRRDNGWDTPVLSTRGRRVHVATSVSSTARVVYPPMRREGPRALEDDDTDAHLPSERCARGFREGPRPDEGKRAPSANKRGTRGGTVEVCGGLPADEGPRECEGLLPDGDTCNGLLTIEERRVCECVLADEDERAGLPTDEGERAGLPTDEAFPPVKKAKAEQAPCNKGDQEARATDKQAPEERRVDLASVITRGCSGGIA